jgi:hypothetical protein
MSGRSWPGVALPMATRLFNFHQKKCAIKNDVVLIVIVLQASLVHNTGITNNY